MPLNNENSIILTELPKMKGNLVSLNLGVDAIMRNLGIELSTSDHKGEVPILTPLENKILDSFSRLAMV